MTVSEPPRNWIVSIKPENWETITKRQFFAFPREDDARKVVQGDRLVAYVTRTYSFKGIFEVVTEWSRGSVPRYPDELSERKVLYPYEAKIRVLVVGTADVKKIKGSLSFIKDKNHIGIYFRRSPGNHGQPISEQDYNFILKELERHTEQEGPMVGSKSRKERPETTGHFDTRDMLVELGKLKGMEEAVSEYKFDHFKLDVAWKRSKVREGPDYAFEVHVGGDLYKDLISLKHAYDRFVCQVILVGQPYDKAMVEQLLSGAFHEMVRNFRFVDTRDVRKLYSLTKQTKELEQILGL